MYMICARSKTVFVWLSFPVLTIYQVTDAVQKYYDYPYDVTIGLEQALSVDFPAVTVCNMNPARYRQHGYPDSKIHVANVGPHVDHTNLG